MNIATENYINSLKGTATRRNAETWSVLNDIGDACEAEGFLFETASPFMFNQFVMVNKVLPTKVLQKLLDLNPIIITTIGK